MTGLLLSGGVYLVALAKWPAAIAICLLAVASWRRLGSRALLLAGIVVLTAVWIDRSEPAPVAERSSESISWHLVVQSMPQQRSNGWDFTAEVLDGENDGLSLLVHSTDPTAPSIGSRVYLRGEIEPREETTSSFDYLTGLGVSGEMYTSEVIIESAGSGLMAWLNERRFRVVRLIQDTVPGDSGSLLAGFVTGDDGRLSNDAEDEFRNAGLSHLTAISGSNLAMLLTMVGVAGFASRTNRRAILVAGVVILWGYALFVDLPPPTLRAALLATLAAAGRWIGRPVDLVGLTLLASAIQIALVPISAWSISFHLSVAASFGLAAGFSRYPFTEVRRGVGELLTATAYAQFATLPLIVGIFGTAPLFGLLANIAAAPFATFAFAVGFTGSMVGLVAPAVGTAMLIPAGWSSDVVLDIAHLFGRAGAQIAIEPLNDALIIGGTLLVLLVLLTISGELRLIRRQFAANTEISPENG